MFQTLFCFFFQRPTYAATIFKDFVEKRLLDFSKVVETGDQFTAISDLQSNEGRILFHTGNVKLIFESVHRNIIVTRYLKYSQGKMKHAPHWFEDLKWL